MKIIIGIYKITSPSGKVYVGQSWNILSRWNYYRHLGIRARQVHVLNSFLKHGYDSHKFEVIHELPPDVEQSVMDLYEQFYMDSYREAGITLMNCREAGSNGKMHPDAIERIRKKNTGQKRQQSTKDKISAANSKRTFSQATKDKIGNANRGKVRTDEVRNRLSQAGKGIKKPAHHGYNVSKALRGVPKSEEHKAALSKSRIEKGIASGANNPRAILNEDIVREIRLKHKAGARLTDLYKEYGISKSGMHSILKGKNWPSVIV